MAAENNKSVVDNELEDVVKNQEEQVVTRETLSDEELNNVSGGRLYITSTLSEDETTKREVLTDLDKFTDKKAFF